MKITHWFNTNDRCFTNPTAALDAGFSLEELAAEYRRVFLPHCWEARFVADLALSLLA